MKTLLLFILITACAKENKTLLGLKGDDKSLYPCEPDSHCVSSSHPSTEAKHYIDPIKTGNDLVSAREKIKTVLSTYPEIKIVEENDSYLKAEYTSKFLKFVDTIEILFVSEMANIKSSSKKNYFFFDSNRSRLEEIRFKFHQSGM